MVFQFVSSPFTFKGSERKIIYYEKKYHIHQQNLIFPPCSTAKRDRTPNLKQIGCSYVYEKKKARNCLTYSRDVLGKHFHSRCLCFFGVYSLNIGPIDPKLGERGLSLHTKKLTPANKSYIR